MEEILDRSERLQSAYGAKNSQELEERYDAWATDYEQDVLSYGYIVPAVTSGMFSRYVKPGEGKVLDAAAGTGMMGDILAPLGYEDLTAIDLSQNMLRIARQKGVYTELRQMELGKRLDFPDNSFGATVATGVFTEGHAPPESFEELVRVTTPGGYVVFSVRADMYLEAGYKEKQESLENESRWTLIEVTEPFAQLPLEDPELESRIFSYQIR